MIVDELPDIPRMITGIAEWGACLVYIALVPKRVRRLALVLILVAALPVLVLVQTVVGMLPLGLWPVGMLIASASMFALILVCADVRPKGAGELLARAFVLAELTASLEWQLDLHFFGGSPGWDVLRIALVVVVYSAALASAWVIERRNFPADLRIPADGRALAAALSIAGVTFLMSNLSFVVHDSPFSGREGREVFYIRTLVDFAGFVALYAIRSQRLTLHRLVEVQSMNTLLHNQHEQYLRSRQQRETVNARYHDLKNYVAAIRHETDEKARSGIVDDLEASMRGFAGLAIDTGNPVVDTMLATKISEAELAGVTVTSVVDGSAVDFMDAIDVVTVLGNAMDNALEAVREVPDPERKLVRIAIYRQEGFVLLRFENYFGGELARSDELPPTSKDDAQHHGYGLKNIRHAAEKYGGTVTVHSENGWFVLRVLLPVPS